MIDLAYEKINNFVEENLQDVINGVKQFVLGILNLIIGALPLHIQLLVRSATGLKLSEEKKEEDSTKEEAETKSDNNEEKKQTSGEAN